MQEVNFSIPKRGFYLVLQDMEVDFSQYESDPRRAADLAQAFEKNYGSKRTGTFSVVMVPAFVVFNLRKIHFNAFGRDEIDISLPKKYNKDRTDTVSTYGMSKYFNGKMMLLDDADLAQIAKNKRDFLTLKGLM